MEGIVQRRVSRVAEDDRVVRFILRRDLDGGVDRSGLPPESRYENHADEDVHASAGLRLKPVLA